MPINHPKKSSTIPVVLILVLLGASGCVATMVEQNEKPGTVMAITRSSTLFWGMSGTRHRSYQPKEYVPVTTTDSLLFGLYEKQEIRYLPPEEIILPPAPPSPPAARPWN